MVNQLSLQAVGRSLWQADFCKPLYDSYCFSKIPGTILQLFGHDGDALPSDCWRRPAPYDTVICILIDGFGWKFLEQYHSRYRFLSRFFKEGIVSKLTSQFPSTTAAHITTLTSGLEVGQTGVFEWFYYEPELDRIIAPLLYTYAGEQKPLISTKLLPSHTLFEKLRSLGTPSHVFQHESIAHSTYSQTMFRGSTTVPYRTLSRGLEALLSKLPEKGLFYFYYGDIDSEAHRHGIEGERTKEAIESCFHTLDQFLSRQPTPNTALIVTADHGMIPIDPRTTLYLNRDIPEIVPLLRRGSDRHVLSPAGSCRDFFLYVYEDKLDEALELLRDRLADQAVVVPTTTLIEEGFFGSMPVSHELLKRVGNMVILPKGEGSIWWYEKGRFEQRFYAMHGGLTRDELETIFLFN